MLQLLGVVLVVLEALEVLEVLELEGCAICRFACWKPWRALLRDILPERGITGSDTASDDLFW